MTRLEGGESYGAKMFFQAGFCSQWVPRRGGVSRRRPPIDFPSVLGARGSEAISASSQSRSVMQALILAAGVGSRLQVDVPKCLVEVGGRSLLDHQLDAIERAGALQTTVVLGFENKRVEEAIGGRAEIVLNRRYAQTNSLYSFWLAREAVKGDLLVLNSDVLFAPEMLADLMAVEGSAIAVDSTSGDQDEQMKVRQQEGRLLSLSKDLPAMFSHGESLGVAHLSALAARAAFASAGSLIRRGRQKDWAASAFNEVAGHHRISCMDVAGQPWVEIDFPEDLALARTRTWPAIAGMATMAADAGQRCAADGPWSSSVESDDLREVAT